MLSSLKNQPFFSPQAKSEKIQQKTSPNITLTSPLKHDTVSFGRTESDSERYDRMANDSREAMREAERDYERAQRDYEKEMEKAERNRNKWTILVMD